VSRLEPLPEPEDFASVELSDTGPQPSRRLRSIRASEVTQELPNWLWHGWLPAGCLSLLVGRQGAGKTTWTAWLLAQLTSGRPMPGAGTHTEGLTVGHLSLEEADGRVSARLAAAGADLDRVHLLGHVDDIDETGAVVQRPWQLPGDCGLLAERITEEGLAMVAIDGLGYAVRGDSHNYANVGSALAGLAQVAAETGAAILGLTHPPKGGSDPTTAAVGSTAWTAIPRVVTVLGIHPDDEKRRVVRVSKTNFAEPPSGWSWRIAEDQEREVGYVTGVGESDVRAEELVAAPDSGQERSALKDAEEWLREALQAGPMPTKALLAEARAAGHHDKTIRRAKDRIGATAVRAGFGSAGEWRWELAPKDGPMPEVDGQASASGHLCSPLAINGSEQHLGAVSAIRNEPILTIDGQGERSGHLLPLPLVARG